MKKLKKNFSRNLVSVCFSVCEKSSLNLTCDLFECELVHPLFAVNDVMVRCDKVRVITGQLAVKVSVDGFNCFEVCID
ncbi:hypothetical protein L6452_34625 [Arctium lappa]|uniref:Uncharacterized protein n=1 Tax=Arctium lappa TaxID=4217 RepID=A0ACB8YJR3_ARCLA|nr:hypothetical protein L6452_34625 [Arctium lappa]